MTLVEGRGTALSTFPWTSPYPGRFHWRHYSRMCRPMAVRKGYQRGLAVTLGVAWLVISASQGGLCQSWRAACHPWRRTCPDARQQWSGPYFDALDALAPCLDRGQTVAVVLSPADHPEQPAPPVRMYETIYRLYPARPDFYFPEGGTDCGPWWFPCRAGEAPQVGELWAHRVVLWADEKRAQLPDGRHPAWKNSVATIYRAG